MEEENLQTKQRQEGESSSPSFRLEKERICTQIHETKVAKTYSASHLVLGGILLVISLIFLFISFKYNSIGQKRFAPQSMEFIACLITGAASLVLLVLGSVQMVLRTKRIKSLTQELNALKEAGKGSAA